ncbi:hypothetical protein Tco_0288144 [Tanacetum coccineum]
MTASKWGTLLNVENLEKENYHCKRLCVLIKIEEGEEDIQKDNCDGEFGNVNNISDEVNFSSGCNTYKKAGGESIDSDYCRESEGSWKGGSILMLMDELVKVGQTIGYNMDGCMKNIEEIIESQGVDSVFR